METVGSLPLSGVVSFGSVASIVITAVFVVAHLARFNNGMSVPSIDNYHHESL